MLKYSLMTFVTSLFIMLFGLFKSEMYWLLIPLVSFPTAFICTIIITIKMKANEDN